MDAYKPRIVDHILRFKCKSKGAVLIEGAKWCGKTTTALQVAQSVLYMQENPAQNLELAQIQPERLLRGEVPRLIDEWQMAPELWDAIRHEVDRRDAFGQFLLTGSAVPADDSRIYHTGTGRFTRMLMRPMSLYESEDSDGSVSLGDLFRGQEEISGECGADLETVAFWICRGGWPVAVGQEREIALQQARDYYDAVIHTDISRVDNVERDEERTARLLRSYARFVASQAKVPSIVADMKANDVESLSEMTVRSYLNALKKIFVIEEAPAWNPNLRSRTAVRTSDTRYFTDPSIATAALGLGPDDLLNDLESMGLFFENLCMRDLRIYADSLDGNVYHYRDKKGLECDAVVHLRNGSFGLVEIKLGGEHLIADAVKTLTSFSEQIDTKKMKPPAFQMILTATGGYAYRRKDGILVVPVGTLKN